MIPRFNHLLALALAIVLALLAVPSATAEDAPVVPQSVQDCLLRHPGAVTFDAVTAGDDLVCVQSDWLASPGDDTYLWVGADTDSDVVLRGPSTTVAEDPGTDTFSLADWTVPLVETYNAVGYGGIFGVRILYVANPEVIRYTDKGDTIGDPNLCGRVGSPDAATLTVLLGAGADTVYCTFANIVTEGGADTVIGASDGTEVATGGGADYVEGDAGTDAISLGIGDDDAVVNGGGADTVIGGAGDDTVTADRTDTVTSAVVNVASRRVR